MEFSRRTFLKSTLVGGVGISALGFDLAPAYAQTQSLKISRATETRSTCPYCSVSCGVIIYTLGDKAKNAIPQVVHVEGDPDHPINRGTLCPKGSSLEQDILNDRRLLKPQVRRPGATDWEDISWEQAYTEIAQKVKKTRDETFLEKDAQDRTVNRCEGMAFTGGCTDTNEFNYLVVKTMRWRPADSRWIRNIGGVVSGSEKLEPPDTGFFNAGQKVQFWEIVAGCAVYLVTGIILWFGAHTFGRLIVAVSYVLHDISALIMLGGIFIHIYLSTIGEPGTFQSMTRGAVSEAWAWTFHPAWYKEVTGCDPRKAYEDALSRMKSTQKSS